MLAPGEIFEFGDFMLDPAERLLLVRGRPRRLTPKAFDLLLVLIRHRGRLVSKDQLLEEVWPSTFVAEVNLSVNISTLRKLLGRDRQAFIETLPKQGYRFVAPVRVRKGVTTTFLRRPDERSPNAEDAHRACLQGRYHWNRRTAEALERAKLHFWRAIAFDPNYAPAYAGLADSYATEGALSYVVPAEAFPAAERHAAMALALDDSLAEPHASLGFAKLYYAWDWASAEAEFRDAIALGRPSAAAHQWLAIFLLAAGRPEEAHEEIEYARSAEPLSLAVNTDLGFIHYYTGRHGEALKQLDAVLEMNPEFPAAHLWRGRVLQELGRFEAAIESFRQVDAQLRGWPVSIAARGHAQAAAGQHDAARQTLAELRQLATRKFVTSYGVALVYAGLGEADTAFAWLERAFDERSNWLVWLRLDPRWRPLHADPRFAERVARLRYPT